MAYRNLIDKSGLAEFLVKIKELLGDKLDTTLKGAADGLAELDSGGKVPTTQLPGDVVPASGNSGDVLLKTADGNQWSAPANAPEENNMKPITSAAVYATIGNINVLLSAI